MNNEMINNDIDDVCPNHAEALRIAGLNPKQFPTFKEISMNIEQDKQQKEKKKKKKNNESRSTCFFVGVCKTWVHGNAFLM